MPEIKKLLEEKDFQLFKPYIDSGYSNPPKSNVMARWLTLREILPSYQEGVVEIEENLPSTDGNGGNRIYTYQINILTDNQVIFYYEFQEKNFRRSNDGNWKPFYTTIDSFAATNKYLQFENAFIQTYHTKLLKDDLFQTIVYGNACGIAGTPTEHEEVLQSFIHHKDIDSLLAWLKSANTEKQLYALKGIKVMRQKGYTPTPEIAEIIKMIKHKKGIVNTCNGCIYSHSTIANVVAEIKSPR